MNTSPWPAPGLEGTPEPARRTGHPKLAKACGGVVLIGTFVGGAMSHFHDPNPRTAMGKLVNDIKAESGHNLCPDAPDLATFVEIESLVLDSAERNLNGARQEAQLKGLHFASSVEIRDKINASTNASEATETISA